MTGYDIIVHIQIVHTNEDFYC